MRYMLLVDCKSSVNLLNFTIDLINRSDNGLELNNSLEKALNS